MAMHARHWALAAVLLIAIALPIPAAAVEPDEVLKDARLEARARALSAELRCFVCQNQSIDESHAPLARDLRLLVRERLVAGDTDAQVRDFIVARYGEFVLLRPRLGAHTLLLWLTPLLVLGIAGAIIVRARRGQSAPEQRPLDPAENARLEQMLSKDGTR